MFPLVDQWGGGEKVSVILCGLPVLLTPLLLLLCLCFLLLFVFHVLPVLCLSLLILVLLLPPPHLLLRLLSVGRTEL